ncbi:transcriptional regulator, AraC family [Phenylobacterium zucineum HLK1]|uniref:Transcriptional regulator, AraC family n=1 Tax=Phenylobacterium zucineum (strain HLK1) TaxID=450851 RepID=B4RCY8_PHEZH|nr:AraC family transcriptional regulator [Phenylobacterium zucineum]ACG79920.1 transcriptional regulator, AraC family [Phenylobacterium zucineum HLK1]
MSRPPLRQILAAGELPRHRHAEGYLAVVLAGGYEEAGEGGRRRIGPGDVVAHGRFEAHLNRVRPAGAQVVNLPLPDGSLPAFGRIADPDAVVRAAERDPAEAAALVLAQHAPRPPDAEGDWPDRLARALAEGPVRIGAWARAHGLSPEHAARGFRQAFGVGPLAFGREARARAAVADALAGELSLAEIALARGFSDQAHLTRAVAALSGRPPGAWRRSNPFKTREPARSM